MAANIGYAISIVLTSLKGWAESPTVTGIETVAAPAKEAPFPSIGVCPAANDYHNSWAPTSLAFDFLELVECDKYCDPNAVLEFRTSFKQFTDSLVDQHFANEVVNNIKWENGTKKPGGFLLPEGYNGYKDHTVFYLLYCQLAQTLSMKNGTSTSLIEYLMTRLKDAIVTQEEFNLDILVHEEGIALKPAEAGMMAVLAGKECEVSSEIQGPERADLAEVNIISFTLAFVAKLHVNQIKSLIQCVFRNWQKS